MHSTWNCSTIQFDLVQSDSLKSPTVFRDSFGTAVGIVDSIALVSGNNTFASNCKIFSGGCPYPSECICNGGGIYVEGSNVTFHGNNTFLGNSATHGGGVFAWHSDVQFSGSGTFRDNMASIYGGGIFLHSSNMIITDSSDITVENNMAQYGGVIILGHSNSI